MFLGEYVQHEEAVSFQLHSSDKQGHYAHEDEDVLQPVASPFRTQDVSHTHGQQENGRRDAQPPCNTSKKLPNNAIVEPLVSPPASQELVCDQLWKVLLESSQRIYYMYTIWTFKNKIARCVESPLSRCGVDECQSNGNQGSNALPVAEKVL